MPEPKPLTGPNDPRHGLYTTYGNHGCRCERCRIAQAAFVKQQRAKRVPPPPDDSRHGSLNCYANFNCRCEPCTGANRAKVARSRQVAGG